MLTRQAALHDAGTAIPVVRGEDREQCLDSNSRPMRTQVLKNIIPMPLEPVSQEISGWTCDVGAIFAPSGRISYDPLLGATWMKGVD